MPFKFNNDSLARIQTSNFIKSAHQFASHKILKRKPVDLDRVEYAEENSAENILNSISDAVLCTDIHGNINYLNAAAEKILGWSLLDVNGCSSHQIFKLINGTTGAPACNPIEIVLESNEPSRLAADTVLIKRDGSEVSIEDSTSPIFNADGVFTGVVVVFHAVNDVKAMNMKMAHLAQHDSLTNLPNRVLLNDRIAQAIANADRHGTQVALLYLDLDKFKQVNDTLGHANGDKLLQSVAKRLSDCIRNADTVSRQGGDEFIVLLADNKDSKDAALTAEKILEELNRPHVIGRTQLSISTSIGISVYPNDATNTENLLKTADTAMYFAKQSGRNNYQFFKPEMNTSTAQNLMIEDGIRLALEKRQFQLHYQPKVNLASNAITGVEVLLRWQHDQWGEMAPEKFIPIAENSGLIIPLGRWILRESCKQIKSWMNAGYPALTVAVNVSAQEFMQKSFVENVRAVLIETQLPAHLLELEITESVLMRNAHNGANTLKQLKKMGIKLVLDDFGTGYSSLSYLQQFPIDALKIDQSFVEHIKSKFDDGIIVSTIISMGSSLKLKVVAEGIENAVQLDFLKNLQCEEGQGYFFSPALTAEEFEIFFSKVDSLETV